MASFNPGFNVGRALSLRWLVWQCGVVSILAIIYFLFAGLQAGYSAALGGLISVLASGYFAWKLFTHTGARSAARIVINLYIAEALKLLIAAACLAAALYWAGIGGRIDATALLIGFIATHLCSLVIIGILTLR